MGAIVLVGGSDGLECEEHYFACCANRVLFHVHFDCHKDQIRSKPEHN